MKWSQSLSTLRRTIRLAAKAVAEQVAPRRRQIAAGEPDVDGGVADFGAFGANPGRLQMLVYRPASAVAAGRPLVVLLHGCGQDAAAFAAQSGWIDLADRLGFPLVLPQQAQVNHQHRCFHWFQPAHTARERGEAGSIAAMTRGAAGQFASDPARVCVVGLSAGGAMAAALLAAYPDLFAAGAVVAGLPVGAADSPVQALLRMAQPGPDLDRQGWGDRARHLAPVAYPGPWPRLSVWQGERDTIVAPGNAGLLVTQWQVLHGLPDAPARDATADGVRHRSWGDALELWTLPDMPHGYPVSAEGGRPGPFLPATPVSATVQIARFFGLG